MSWDARTRAKGHDDVDELGLVAQSRSSEPKDGGQELELARQMNVSLHELSQPLTALLCALEMGESNESVADLKQLMRGGLEECRRLQATVHDMQMQIQQVYRREGPNLRVWT